MASPIFLSNASPSLSFLGIFRGFQLAILGIYRGLQNPNITSRNNNKKIFFRLAMDTALVQLIIAVPIVSLWLTVRLVSLVTAKDYSDLYASIIYVQKNVININFVLVNFISMFRLDRNDQGDLIFYESLKFFDSDYSEALLALESETAEAETLAGGESEIEEMMMMDPARSDYFFSPASVIIRCLEKLGWIEQNVHNTQVIQNYSKLVFTNAAVYLLANIPRYGPFISSIFLLQNLLSITGITVSCVITLLLFQFAPTYVVSSIFLFNESNALMMDLIVNPYFNKLFQFTRHEKSQWIKSREGILIGWSMCFNLLINLFPMCSLLFILLSKSSLGYLISKVSDSPPDSRKKLVNWTTSQVVWNKERQEHVLSGDFVNDSGFIAIPGSFLL